MESSNAPNRAESPEQEGQTGADDDSAMDTEDEYQSVEETNMSGSVALDKVALMKKLEQMEKMKEETVVKFDGEIAALRTVLAMT